jgi:hypothetical protein
MVSSTKIPSASRGKLYAVPSHMLLSSHCRRSNVKKGKVIGLWSLAHGDLSRLGIQLFYYFQRMNKSNGRRVLACEATPSMADSGFSYFRIQHLIQLVSFYIYVNAFLGLQHGPGSSGLASSERRPPPPRQNHVLLATYIQYRRT